jgi:hypothetical protein
MVGRHKPPLPPSLCLLPPPWARERLCDAILELRCWLLLLLLLLLLARVVSFLPHKGGRPGREALSRVPWLLRRLFITGLGQVDVDEHEICFFPLPVA